METVPATKNVKQMKIKNSRNTSFAPWLFLAPHLIIFGVFFLIPIFFGVYISFTEWDLISSPIFVGLDNYKELLLQPDSVFYEQLHNGLKNTFYLFYLLSHFVLLYLCFLQQL
ncbi:hypothetical protein AAHB53_03800 [Niallia circulans]